MVGPPGRELPAAGSLLTPLGRRNCSTVAGLRHYETRLRAFLAGLKLRVRLRITNGSQKLKLRSDYEPILAIHNANTKALCDWALFRIWIASKILQRTSANKITNGQAKKLRVRLRITSGQKSCKLDYELRMHQKN